MRRRKPVRHPALFLPFSAALVGAMSSPAALDGQSPQDILREAMELHEARLAAIDDVTIDQEVMGIPATTYLVKETVDGVPVLRASGLDIPGIDPGPMEEIGDLWADPRALYLGLNDRWELDGRGSFEGRETWRLVITDVDDVDWGRTGDGSGRLHPHRVDLELDTDDLVPRVVVMEGEVDADGDVRPFSLRVELSDYRETDGYLHPYLTSIETDLAAAGLSEQDIVEARAALDQLVAELEQLPEGQRAMMEEALGPQMRMLEELLQGESIRLEVRVTDLRVNEGPPDAS